MAPVAEQQPTKPVEEQEPTTKTEEPQKEEISSSAEAKPDAHEKLNAGKRNLLCDEYPQAVESLADACQLLAEKYGEEGNELAEAYYYYGRALLELARMENGVLGNALDGVAAEEENEADLSESEQFEKASEGKDVEREEIMDKVYSAMSEEEKAKKDSAASENKEAPKDGEKVDDAENKSEDKSADAEKTDASEIKSEENKPAEDKTEQSETAESKTEEVKSEESKSAAEEKSEEKMDDDSAAAGDGEDAAAEDEESADDEEGNEDGASSSQEEGEDADDVPNLQLAWEVLELSKKIYNKQAEGTEVSDEDKKALKLKLSEVYKTLGEVSLETGAYEQAVQDMKSCLEIQLACLEADSRFIAETHYQLGNAHLLNKGYTTAVTELRTAKSVIETRIGNLEKKLEGEDKEKNQKQLDDLRTLLPDIIAKVEDAEDESRNAERAETELKNMAKTAAQTTIGFGDSSDSSATAAPISTIQTKKANDISNLVRKRKPEEQDNEDAKKPKSEVTKTEEKENGVAKENGQAEVVANGH